MDCPISNDATVFGIHDWLNYLQDQPAKYRKLVERADDPFVKTELLALASVCEEIADNIEDHLTGGEDQAPRGPLPRLSWKRTPTDAALLPLEQIGQVWLENLLCLLEQFEKVDWGWRSVEENKRSLALNDEPARVNVALRLSDLLFQGHRGPPSEPICAWNRN
jgi:hypothetical protein